MCAPDVMMSSKRRIDLFDTEEMTWKRSSDGSLGPPVQAGFGCRVLANVWPIGTISLMASSSG